MKKYIILLALLITASGLYALLPQPTESWGTDQFLISSRRQYPPELDSILAQPDPEWPVYGIYSWCYEYGSYHAGIAQMGWKNVRIAGSMTNAGMMQLCQDSVRVMYTASGTKRDQFSNDDDFIAAYKTFLTTFLNTYGPGGSFFASNPTVPNIPVTHVEIWNEPNFQYMIPDFDPMTTAYAQRDTLYSKLLPEAYAHIKATWPTVNVVGFGAGGAAGADVGFIKRVHNLNPAVGSSYDILSTHPYSEPAPPECQDAQGVQISPSLNNIRTTMDSAGAGGKEVWYTEIGWPITQAEGGYYAGNGSSTQREQAAYSVRLYAWAMRLGVPFVSNMFVSDTDGFNGGFFNRDKSWREAATAVNTMTTLMPHPKLVAAVNDGDRYWYAYKFIHDVNAASPETVIMAWDLKGPRTITDVTVGATVIDMLGTETTVGGDGTLEIGPLPVYITNGTISSIREADIAAGLRPEAVDISPNPFTHAVRMTMTVKPGQAVEAVITDHAGRVAAYPEMSGAGLTRSLEWDGTGLSGSRVKPGVYFLRLILDGSDSYYKIMFSDSE